MLTKPDIQTLRALYGLSRHSGGEEVLKLLQAELDATLIRLTVARDADDMRRLQGRAQFVSEFIECIRSAGDTLEKLRDTSL